jgi:hypothetical protein
VHQESLVLSLVVLAFAHYVNAGSLWLPTPCHTARKGIRGKLAVLTMLTFGALESGSRILNIWSAAGRGTSTLLPAVEKDDSMDSVCTHEIASNKLLKAFEDVLFPDRGIL